MICYYDGTNNLKFCTKNNWSSTLGTAVGIVVISPEHTLDGKVRVMSLKYMSCITPNTGSSNYDNISWG